MSRFYFLTYWDTPDRSLDAYIGNVVTEDEDSPINIGDEIYTVLGYESMDEERPDIEGSFKVETKRFFAGQVHPETFGAEAGMYTVSHIDLIVTDGPNYPPVPVEEN